MDVPPDQYELYAEFGLAADIAQGMETAAGNFLLSYAMAFMDVKDITPEVSTWFKEIIEDINSKTFGTLLKHFKKTAMMDDNIISIVNEALEKRNYLTHHFFRFHNFSIHSEEGRREMIGELREIQKKLDLAQKVLDGLGNCLDQLAGRGDFAKDITEKLQAQGKRVKL